MSRNAIDIFASQFLDKLDKLDHPPTREEKFMTSILLKNIYDLCNDAELIARKNPKSENLVNHPLYKISKPYLKSFYSDDFFIESEECGIVPDWEVIDSFNNDKFNDSCRIYMVIKKNVLNNPKIHDSIVNRDRKYFIDNFESLFENIPFSEYFGGLKKFLEDETLCSLDDQEIVWSYFEVFTDLFINEDEYISSLPK